MNSCFIKWNTYNYKRMSYVNSFAPNGIDFTPLSMRSSSLVDDSPLFLMVSFDTETAALEELLFLVYWLPVNFLFFFLGC